MAITKVFQPLILALAVTIGCGSSDGATGLSDALDLAANEMTMRGEKAHTLEYRHTSGKPYSVALVASGGFKNLSQDLKQQLKAERCELQEPMIVVADADETQCVTYSRVQISSFRIVTKNSGEVTRLTIAREGNGYSVVDLQ